MKKCLDILLDVLFAIFGLIGKIFRLLHREREAVPTTSASVNPVISNISEINLPKPDTMPVATPKPAEIKVIIPKKVEIANPTPETKKQAFIEALRIVVVDKFDPLIVFTHSYNESANWKKVIGNCNSFGLKVPIKYLKTHKPPFAGWDGAVVKNVMTHEENKNGTEFLPQDFMDFSSFDNQMTYYCFHIQRVFLPAWENRNSPQAYFYWLQKIGYFTDRDGANTLTKLYAHLKTNGEYQKMLDILNGI